MTILATRNLSESKYKNTSKEFIIKEKKFSNQYAPLYAERLVSMRSDIKETAIKYWSNKYQVKGLVELEKDEKCIIVGTLYKEMKNKPNILKELADDENNTFAIQPVLTIEKYIDDSDELILEDELQRILLIDPSQVEAPKKGKFLIKDNKLCTGLVIALLGHENENSKFEVEDYCFKDTAYTQLPKQIQTSTQDQDKYVVFVSGFELGDTNMDNNLFKLQLFIDFVCGDFMSNEGNEAELTDYEKKMKKILTNTQRLIIAGNSLSSSTQSKDMHNKAKYLTKNFIAGSVNSMKKLDEVLSQLIRKIEVDVMPGEFDPTNLMLPQQPLHHSMFTKSIASPYKYNLHTPTNPYSFSFDNISFMGTSGQFIDDIRRSTALDDPIELMKLTLDGGHLGPTCPDTLACYPYYGKDPFIINQLPHVYFAGNQPEFKHATHLVNSNPEHKVHLLSLPKFSKTNSCVFFNLNTFECEEIFF
jgi:DNA polymerase delta subunit 2